MFLLTANTWPLNPLNNYSSSLALNLLFARFSLFAALLDLLGFFLPSG